MKKVKTANEMQQALNDFAKNAVEKEFINIVRKTGFYIHAQMFIYTPKDTGFASQHWSISKKENENITVTIDQLQNLKIGENVYIFSNVPYIKRLDEGHSLQRPSGFTHLVLRNAKSFIENEIQKQNNKKYE